MNKLFLGPAEVAAFTSQVGVNKTSMNKVKAFVLAIFAGMFIGFAAYGSNTASSRSWTRRSSLPRCSRTGC